MRKYDVLIVGGGPAGSACARKLVQAGRSVAVLDREEFPRTKLCAGWVTPEAVADLELDVGTYPHRFSTFEHIIAHVKGLTIKLDTPQHSIRRFEFKPVGASNAKLWKKFDRSETLKTYIANRFLFTESGRKMVPL